MKRHKKINLLAVIIVICLAYYAVINIPVLIKMIYPLYFQETIIKHAKEYALPPALVAAVIKTESNFDVFAESGKNAKGLMQITPSTGKWIAEKLHLTSYNDDMLYDPEINIQFGCWYIKYLYNIYDKNMTLALAAYNGGRGNVDKWLEDEKLSRESDEVEQIPFKETKNFVIRVDNNFRIYNQLYKWE